MVVVLIVVCNVVVDFFANYQHFRQPRCRRSPNFFYNTSNFYNNYSSILTITEILLVAKDIYLLYFYKVHKVKQKSLTNNAGHILRA